MPAKKDIKNLLKENVIYCKVSGIIFKDITIPGCNSVSAGQFSCERSGAILKPIFWFQLTKYNE